MWFEINPITRDISRWKNKSEYSTYGIWVRVQLGKDRAVILNLYFYADSTGHPGTWQERESFGRLTIRAPEGVAWLWEQLDSVLVQVILNSTLDPTTPLDPFAIFYLVAIKIYRFFRDRVTMTLKKKKKKILENFPKTFQRGNSHQMNNLSSTLDPLYLEFKFSFNFYKYCFSDRFSNESNSVDFI